MSEIVLQEQYVVVAGTVLLEVCENKSDAERIASLLLRWSGRAFLEVITAVAFAKRSEEKAAARKKQQEISKSRYFYRDD